mgnify:CR=1 FL=1
MKKKEKYVSIYLERLKELDPDLAILVQDIIRSNAILKYRLGDLLKENIRLREEKVALEIRIRTLETALETWRGEYERLNALYEKVQREYILLKQEYNKIIMLKGVTELTYQSLLSALQNLLNRLDEYFSKPSFKAGEEHVKDLIREIRSEIISIIQVAKEKEKKEEKIEETPTE